MIGSAVFRGALRRVTTLIQMIKPQFRWRDESFHMCRKRTRRFGNAIALKEPQLTRNRMTIHSAWLKNFGKFIRKEFLSRRGYCNPPWSSTVASNAEGWLCTKIFSAPGAVRSVAIASCRTSGDQVRPLMAIILIPGPSPAFQASNPARRR